MLILDVIPIVGGYEPVVEVPLKVPFGALSPAKPEPVKPVPLVGTIRSWP